jgi:hypothetical protein
MKEVQYRISWGGYIGAEDIYSVFVDDDADETDIENAISEDYEERLHDECYWEIVEEEEE